MIKKKVNVLFVCRYNRFRSRVAEAYFRKINTNRNIKAKSAGLIKGQPLSPFTVGIAKEFGLNIDGRVKGLSSRLLAWQNITVIVADNVPPEVFSKNKEYRKRVIVWKIADIPEKNKGEIKRLIKTIIKNVEEFAKLLEKEK